MFITFEGPDGAGKTTQLHKLAQALRELGYPVVTTREPGGTPISDKIRSILLSPEHHTMSEKAEVLLYAASRAQHVHEFILPALQENMIVICDRYIDASIAYQAYGLGINEQLIREVNHFASSGLAQTRTYMIDVPVEISLSRLNKRAAAADASGLDRIEQRSQAYHEKVREGFLRIADTEKHRILLVDGTQEENVIAQAIEEDCKRLLKPE